MGAGLTDARLSSEVSVLLLFRLATWVNTAVIKSFIRGVITEDLVMAATGGAG